MVQNLACSWWRHQMETFSALLAICAGNLPIPGEFPTQRPVTPGFGAFFDLRLNKRLSKQWWGWWYETLSCPLWRHRNAQSYCGDKCIILHSLMMSAKSRMCLACRSYSFLYITPSYYHHYANLSEDIELIKCLSDIFCPVCEQDQAYSLLSIIQYVGLCVFSLPVPPVMNKTIHILCLIVIIKSEV